MGDPEQEARCLCSLAIAARKLNALDQAAAAIEEALQINRRIEFRAGEAWNLRIWGELELTRGRYEDARRLLEESLAAEKEVDCLSGQVWNLVGLARTTRALNDRAASLRYHRDALKLASSIEMKRPILFALESGAALLEDCGLPVPAVRLLAAASTLREQLEAPRATHDQVAWEENLATDRSRIGTEAFDTAWGEGSKMSLEAAVSEALGTIVALQE
jgi:tetratricopeptide (TPR) repeat protein